MPFKFVACVRRDLEELRSELEDDEYEETRRDTLEQMTVRYTGRDVCVAGKPVEVQPRAPMCDVNCS